jgi:hypothetical protein
MAVVELGGFSEDLGDKLVSGEQFVQDSRFHWHRREGQGWIIMAAVVGWGRRFRVVPGGAFL